ncbi:hypothetical protein DFA_11375 [Cavenderia fasciculata]|uniref:Uncharacterized protein n=1 Tax=Cavenderia fasciculata TaxID=261658 RepID=F4QCN2_CACFS|nr:uncharacterized protein DFA_11375 [Cavenderia fasciculata]EGG13614.1 hypothetical protein DFA_11375 [Cavenderia fasciculata]|eukprot:XP_004350318.1 hypothetical protein DFA_11375 [Cavenderia fasciculata]
MSFIARRTSTNIYKSFVRSYSVSVNNDAKLLDIINKDSTEASLNKVFSEINDTTGSAVYNTLIDRYAKLNLDGQCMRVYNASKMRNVPVSDSANKIIEEQWEDKNVKEEDDDFSSLGHIREDFLKYKESKTRRPWLN